MQDQAIQDGRVYPGNRAEVIKWQQFQPAYQEPGWKNQDLRKQARPPSHKNTSKMSQSN